MTYRLKNLPLRLLCALPTPGEQIILGEQISAQDPNLSDHRRVVTQPDVRLDAVRNSSCVRPHPDVRSAFTV